MRRSFPNKRTEIKHTRKLNTSKAVEHSRPERIQLIYRTVFFFLVILYHCRFANVMCTFIGTVSKERLTLHKNVKCRRVGHRQHPHFTRACVHTAVPPAEQLTLICALARPSYRQTVDPCASTPDWSLVIRRAHTTPRHMHPPLVMRARHTWTCNLCIFAPRYFPLYVRGQHASLRTWPATALYKHTAGANIIRRLGPLSALLKPLLYLKRRRLKHASRKH